MMRRLASLIAEKRGLSFSIVMNWIRSRFSFSLMRSAIACIQGSGCKYSHKKQHDYVVPATSSVCTCTCYLECMHAYLLPRVHVLVPATSSACTRTCYLECMYLYLLPRVHARVPATLSACTRTCYLECMYSYLLPRVHTIALLIREKENRFITMLKDNPFYSLQ